MIPQNQNNTGSRVGQYGLNPNATRTNSGRSTALDVGTGAAIGVGVLTTLLGQGGSRSGNQTTTQQNLPDWAIPYAQNTMNIGSQFTMNPNYRPSTLDQDYSGIRGYTGPPPTTPRTNLDGTDPYRPNDINNLVAQLPPDMQGGGLNLGRRPGTGLKFADGWSPESSRGSGSSPGVGIADRVGANILEDDAQRQEMLRQREGNGTMQSPQGFRGRPATGLKFADQMPTSRGGGRQNSKVLEEQTQLLENPVAASPPSGNSVYVGYGRNYDPTKIYTDLELNALAQSPSGEFNESIYNQLVASQSALKNAQQAASSAGGEGTEDGEEEEPVPFGEMLTPFQAYDRQRFAAPGQNTLRGEGILSGRYDQRFGPGGTDPFAAANQAVGSAANYTSGFQGTMGEGGLGGQAGNYQQGLGSATDPNVFQAGNYTSGLPNFANPNANVSNVNQGLRSTTFGNANANLTGAQNYNRNFQDLVNQSNNPYQDQVVNQTIADLNRAREMTQNEIGGQAAKAGAFGGSRQALLEAENNRNYLDRVAAATGQLRQQGFESAANRASQENLQRLGLTASDTQNVRGLQSQGNLAAQGLTARDAQDVRGLTSQGGLAAQGLQSQGALAALGANAGLYQSALGLNAAGDRSAMGYNAGLLSDAMRLDASDLNQRRNLASNEAQFEETANRGAGALNLQGGQALGQLAQAGTADERQRIADILAAGAGQDNRNQQDLDFIYNEFQRELGYPMDMINLRNAAISPATNSVVTTSSPLYGQNPLLQGLGAGLSTYSLLKD